MATSDFVSARYGDAAEVFLDSDRLLACERRQSSLWRVLNGLLGTDHREPLTHDLHSPRALPAFLGTSRLGQTAIIWDAGLGTLFDTLSFSMPYPQPPDVIEAMLRRLVAVRCVIAWHADQGQAQTSRADALLKRTPIDRTFQQNVDAESQFEVFLLVELQERFALAHELAHYLKFIDRDSFGDFASWAVQQLREAAAAELDPGLLGRGPWTSRGLGQTPVDPHAWYLNRGFEPVSPQALPVLDEALPAALTTFDGLGEHDQEEILCDLLAASALAVAAHRRQGGWSAEMAITCSRLALSNLRAITAIDAWVAIGGVGTIAVEREASWRQSCMTAFLPVLTAAVLRDATSRWATPPGDAHTLLQLVEHRFTTELGDALGGIHWLPVDADAAGADRRSVIAHAAFFPFRPPADHRVSVIAANRWRFEVGVVTQSPGLYALYRSDPSVERAVLEMLDRHQRGDWAHLYDEDRLANEEGLFQEFQPATDQREARRDAIWSFFELHGEAVTIVTRRDRRSTQIMFERER